jgi:hypothetical protein
VSDLLVSNVSHVESESAELTMNSSSLILASVSSVMFNISGAVNMRNNSDSKDNITVCRIWGSHNSGYEEFCLLGHNELHDMLTQKIKLFNIMLHNHLSGEDYIVIFQNSCWCHENSINLLNNEMKRM